MISNCKLKLVTLGLLKNLMFHLKLQITQLLVQVFNKYDEDNKGHMRGSRFHKVEIC
jgi:hypothetical protein